MKRIWICLLVFALLCGNALAALEYNSFFDDTANAGRFNRAAKMGDYVYWLNRDHGEWEEYPYNLYCMKPGDENARMVLEGREDLWIWDVVCIGDELLLSVSEDMDGQCHPALVDAAGDYRELPGNIGSVVMGAGKIYNSVDGAIYEINIETLKPKKIYTYPSEIAGDNPVLFQCEGLNLYFCTDSFDQYRLDLQMNRLTKIANIRGDGFVKNYKFYVSDYDNGGTYCYDPAGNRSKISEKSYIFQWGSSEYVGAINKDEDLWYFGFPEAEAGVILDMTWLGDQMENALIGSCDVYNCFMLEGELYKYDYQNNRVDLSSEAVAELLKK